MGAQRSNPEEQIVRASMAEHGSSPGTILLRNVVKTIPDPFRPGARLTFGLGTGTPDVVGSLVCPCPTCGTMQARPIGLEYKSPTGAAQAHQLALHEAWRSQGWLIAMPRSVDATGETLRRWREGR